MMVGRKRVIQACTGFPPDRQGGAESVVSCILSGLPRSEFDTRVITRLWRTRIDEDFVTQFATLPGEGMGYLTWGLAAMAAVLRERPDILHCHGLEGAVLCGAAKVGARARVMHVHNSLSREENFLDSRRHRWGYELLANACTTADAVVCPTSIVRDDVLTHLPSIRQQKVVVLPNPVAVGRLHSEAELSALRRRWGLNGKQVILYFGKIKRSKGIEEMCEAYEKLEWKDRIKLVVAGAPTATDRFLTYLKETYPDVVFTGFVEDPVIYYQIADLFCIYTAGFEGGETFAVALAQAMRQKVPVVCSDNAIFREVTRNAAIFAPPHDPDALSRAFATALYDPESLRPMVEHSFEVAEHEYAPDVFLGRLRSLYSRLV
jgi:glycosyltransferase involved in cell wall biosynthesis